MRSLGRAVVTSVNGTNAQRCWTETSGMSLGVRLPTFHYAPPFRHDLTVVHFAAAMLSQAQTNEHPWRLDLVPAGFMLTIITKTHPAQHIFHIDADAALDALLASVRLANDYWDNGVMAM